MKNILIGEIREDSYQESIILFSLDLTCPFFSPGFHHNHQSVAVQLVNCGEWLALSQASSFTLQDLSTHCGHLAVWLRTVLSSPRNSSAAFFSIDSSRMGLHILQLSKHPAGQRDCCFPPSGAGAVAGRWPVWLPLHKSCGCFSVECRNLIPLHQQFLSNR